jgi:hypothetical protein
MKNNWHEGAYKLRQYLKKCSVWLMLTSLIAFNSCIVSNGPFYENDQIVQDDRIDGTYENQTSWGAKDGSVWIFQRSSEEKSKYRILVEDKGSKVELLGTFFQIDNDLYLDLFPIRDSGMRNMSGGAPTASELLHITLFDPRHAILRVDLSDKELSYSFPMESIRKAMQLPELKVKRIGDFGVLVLPESAIESQKYLRKFGKDKSFFDYKSKMIKNISN